MQFSKEVNWNLFDFIVADLLLFSISPACEFELRKVAKTKQRIAICAELALGIFVTPFAEN